MGEMLGYQFVQNAIVAALLASVLCGLVGTFVVVKRLVFVSGGVSHAAFGGLGIFYFFGLPPLVGGAVAALFAALLLAGRSSSPNRSQDAVIGILWAVGMAIGVLFMARTPGYAPNLASYLFGDILAVSRPLNALLGAFVVAVAICVGLFFKELLAVAFDEEYARTQGVSARVFLIILMVLIALSVVLLIQVVGAILAIALLTIPPVISLSLARSFRAVIGLAILVAILMTLSGLAISFRWDLPSGPTIVLFGFGLLLLVKAFERLGQRRATAALVAAATLLFPALTGPPLAMSDDDGNEISRGLVGRVGHLELLGDVKVVTDSLDSSKFGGLSGLAYDVEREVYYAISDDRAERGPARFYTLTIDLSSGRLEPDDVRVLELTDLATDGGEGFGAGRIDPEAIALTTARTLVIASEGDARIELPPFLREFDLEGRQLRDFPLGQRYTPRRDGQSGVRANLALESATITPSGRYIFSATESALAQDGPVSDLDNPSPGRILRYNREENRIDAEYLYWIDPVIETPDPVDAYSVSGVVDLLALSDDRLLVLERSFSVGRGNDVRVYEVDLRGASDIHPIAELARHGTEELEAVPKELLLHVNSLGVRPDNLEGIAFGAPLPDGRPTLLLISDDNFNPLQFTQLLAFAIGTDTPTVAAIQGRGHRSPLAGDWVVGVEGVVTAVDTDERRGGFFLQQPGDGDPTTSDALFVTPYAEGVRVGDRVRVSGAVSESARTGSLPLTRLVGAQTRVLASGEPLPEPVRLGRDGRPVPSVVVDDDGLSRFDPCCDAIDYFESLEGMRVEVVGATAVSGTSRHGEVVVVADGGLDAGERTGAGGVRLRPGDPNPERLILDDRLVGDSPSVRVGDRFVGPVIGVLEYAFSNYRIQVEEWPGVEPTERPDPVSASGDGLTIASYNVLNLDPSDGPEQFEGLASGIVESLGSPALIGLQEVQDDNGADDEGIASAERTLSLLAAAVVDAGGPGYEFAQIDPEHNADGGEPNGNIRVVWMFDPERVGIERLERVAVESPAFAGDSSRGWEGGRKCLAADVRAAGETLLAVNCHLKSKRGDDRFFGSNQPPVFHTEEQRSEQVREVLEYIDGRLASEPELQVVLLGDMNEHEFRPPMRLAAAGGLVNLTLRVPASDRYTYNFIGNSQLLDHVFASRALADRVQRVEILHLNTDEPDGERSSDHDPLLIEIAPR